MTAPPDPGSPDVSLTAGVRVIRLGGPPFPGVSYVDWETGEILATHIGSTRGFLHGAGTLTMVDRDRGSLTTIDPGTGATAWQWGVPAGHELIAARAADEAIVVHLRVGEGVGNEVLVGLDSTGAQTWTTELAGRDFDLVGPSDGEGRLVLARRTAGDDGAARHVVVLDSLNGDVVYEQVDAVAGTVSGLIFASGSDGTTVYRFDDPTPTDSLADRQLIAADSGGADRVFVTTASADGSGHRLAVVESGSVVREVPLSALDDIERLGTVEVVVASDELVVLKLRIGGVRPEWLAVEHTTGALLWRDEQPGTLAAISDDFLFSPPAAIPDRRLIDGPTDDRMVSATSGEVVDQPAWWGEVPGPLPRRDPITDDLLAVGESTYARWSPAGQVWAVTLPHRFSGAPVGLDEPGIDLILLEGGQLIGVDQLSGHTLWSVTSTPGENSSPASRDPAPELSTTSTIAPRPDDGGTTSTAAPPDDEGNASGTGDPRTAQVLLDVAGYGPLEYDGILGPASTAALEAFQRAAGLPVTGALDAATFDRLLVETADSTYVPTCDGPTARPGGFQFACADFSEFEEVTWSSWSAVAAVGAGSLRMPCPNYSCDDGSTHQVEPVAIRLDEAESLQCGDVPAPWLEFTRVTLVVDGGDPNVFTLDGPYC